MKHPPVSISPHPPATPRPWRLPAAGTLGLALWLVGQPAAAQQAAASSAPSTKVECAQAFEQSQRLRNAAQYLEANREVLKCTNPACGAALSEECGKIHAELQAATPSIVFGARDETGQELTAVSVVIDRAPVALPIDGKPVALDPGSHTFAFSADGFETQLQSLVVRTGERFRPVTVKLERQQARSAKLAPQPDAPDVRKTREPSSGGPPLGTYVLGGVAALGLGSFIGLRVWGAHDFDVLARECKPHCAPSSVDSVKQKYLLSNVALAVGGAAAIAAVSIYWASPKTSQRAAKLQVLPSSDGISARIAAPF